MIFGISLYSIWLLSLSIDDKLSSHLQVYTQRTGTSVCICRASWAARIRCWWRQRINTRRGNSSNRAVAATSLRWRSHERFVPKRPCFWRHWSLTLGIDVLLAIARVLHCKTEVLLHRFDKFRGIIDMLPCMWMLRYRFRFTAGLKILEFQNSGSISVPKPSALCSTALKTAGNFYGDSLVLASFCLVMIKMRSFYSSVNTRVLFGRNLVQ